MDKKIILAGVLAILVIGAGFAWFFNQNTENMDQNNGQNIENSSEEERDASEEKEVVSSATHTNPDNPRVTLATSEGAIVLELFEDKAPVTAGNFIKLAEEGFYNGTKFHRVIQDFMIQGGDPNTKTDNTDIYGTGGPGYTIEDEFVEGMYNYKGTISMANSGRPNSGGSQFFINLTDNNFLDFDKDPLASKHPVFGRVIGGMDIVEAIGSTETGARDLPSTPIVIREVKIEK